MNKSLGVYALVFMCLSMFDRITKIVALYSCASEKIITSYFSCEMVMNRGFALSLGHDCAPWLLYITILVTLCVTLLCCRYASVLWRSQLSLWGIGCIIVGAISNVIDRFLYGGVIDFIVLHYQGWEFPTFNVADVMICGGVMLLMLQKKE